MYVKKDLVIILNRGTYVRIILILIRESRNLALELALKDRSMR